MDVDLSRYNLSEICIPKSEIYRILPHRFEFEQLDGLFVCDIPNKVLIGFRDLRPDEFWTRGHVPGNPIFPGVLMVEAAAQLTALAAKLILPELRNKFIAFAGIDGARFRGIVRPGDRVILVAKGTTATTRIVKAHAWGLVNDKEVFEGEIIGIPIAAK
jgi:3-hydroxyacyl-[acyl-carrier-protein] dehydratase